MQNHAGQTIHTNVISWVCSVTQATQPGILVDSIYGVNGRCVPSKLISLRFHCKRTIWSPSHSFRLGELVVDMHCVHVIIIRPT